MPPRADTADTLASRGGLKLQAAHRALRAAAAGCAGRGPSTWAPRPAGSPRCCCATGAAAVTAVDVGHGQLHRAAAARSRGWRALERTDWKTLSLTRRARAVRLLHRRRQLRGRPQHAARAGLPAAARAPRGWCWSSRSSSCPTTWSRAATCRRPGAAGAGAGRASRRRRSGWASGCAHAIDSPVAGGSGTVEILAHLRFEGRPATLPGPGERSRPGPQRSRAAPARPSDRRRLRWFAVAAPGLEEAVQAEVARAAGGDAGASGGGRRRPCRAALEVGMRANLRLRVATRVLLRAGRGGGARVQRAAPAGGQAALGALRAARPRRCGRCACRPAPAAAACTTPARWPRRCWRWPIA